MLVGEDSIQLADLSCYCGDLEQKSSRSLLLDCIWEEMDCWGFFVIVVGFSV